jgi:preprotein translocase subunit SecA
MRHFDVQILAGIALHEGKIVEQKTGEGKTLTATLPLYLNALEGKGAHLVTVNDYLVRRDAGWMGLIYHFLGLQTAAIISETSFIVDPEYVDSEAQDVRLSHLKPVSRKEAYEADITYGINSEFGFDYLRDNMAQTPEELRQRDFHFAIIDEADSVLIDEARTPHIISAPYEEETSKYYQYAKIVKQLDAKTDYVIDEKLRTANITEAGITKIEQILGVANVYEQDFDTLFHIEAALKAETLFKLDKDYIVQSGEVVIVDEFTGRLLQGRRFSEGLHQAIEAKEGVQIQKESKTLATVSLQNYFRMYKKLAGMTGTAATEAEEFHKIYKTDTLVMPTHRSMVRKDHPDMIYKTEQAKFNAVVEEIAHQHQLGRPVLVGTTSIEKNERLSHLLHKKGVKHELLNAKNHEREAQIIAQAGEKGAVTVATNMAGRGVDIILGGTLPDKPTKKQQEEWQKNHDEVVEAGGLYVIGTERHESRRIDNQLRGRAGRQGDPGDTVFFVSLEDDMMRIFGGDQIAKLMTMLKFPEDQPLSHPMVTRSMEQAQVKVEGFNFDIRKHLVDFDDVLNKQREIVYTLRMKIVKLAHEDPEKFKETVFDIFKEQITSMMSSYMTLKNEISDEELHMLDQDLGIIFSSEKEAIQAYFKKRNFDELQTFLLEKVEEYFAQREKAVGKDIWYDVVRTIFLSIVDQYWTEHLTAIEDLREGINLRGYAQLDPLVEYKNEAYSMFERLITNINYEFTRRLFRIEVQLNTEEIKDEAEKEKKELKKEKERPMVLKSASAINPFTVQEQKAAESPMPVGATPADREYTQTLGGELGLKVTPPGVAKKKIGRNDPCWCGSGKKYKKCHMNSDAGIA